ncbi:hypothetical protein ACFZA1_41100 [Streptomyces filipinensis]|uniref:hypothetical protein n=1 Tax=Streptomyces filipinensis TaxID=66887 RepID=UPI0036ECF703
MANKSEASTKSSELYENLWASPALFTFTSVAASVLARTDRGRELAWWIYFAGWAALLLMGLLSLVSGGKPADPAAWIGLSVLVLFGVVQGVFNSGGWPV